MAALASRLGTVAPRKGDTLLHMALRHGATPEMVSVVIELGANRKLCNEAGELPGQVNEEAPHTLKKADMLIEIKKQRELVERAKAGATAKDGLMAAYFGGKKK